MTSKLKPLLVSSLVGAALWLYFGHGFVNYDTLYSLLWGGEIFHGERPDYGADLAPTPHPLITLFGVLVTPLGAAAQPLTVVLAFLMLGALSYLVFAVTEVTFGRVCGLLAALLIITREPVLSFGVRAYVDIPYLVLLLSALLLELRTQRSGIKVLILLALAGLIRPEAWLFSLLYLVYLSVTYNATHPSQESRTPLTKRFRVIDTFSVRQASYWLLAALAAPVLWLLTDLATTGDLLYSFDQTHRSTEVLGRATGAAAIFSTAPWRLGETAREAVLFAAVLSLPLLLTVIRLNNRQLKVLITALVAAALAFCLLAVTGLPVITRYLLLPATLLCIFAAYGTVGWLTDSGASDRLKLPGRFKLLPAFVTALVLAVFAVPQAQRIAKLRTSITTQSEIREDLKQTVEQANFGSTCVIYLPNHRAVPDIAFQLKRRPSEIRIGSPKAGQLNTALILPANRRIANSFILDKRDRKLPSLTPPQGFTIKQTPNKSWRIYTSPVDSGPCNRR